MRSSAAKLALGVAAWLAVGAAALFILQSERQVAARRGAVRAFDVVARETIAALTGVRASQQGYVAPGQGLGSAMARVDGLLTTASSRLDELRSVAAVPETGKALGEVSGTLSDLRAIDKRARQYVNADQPLMAADVVFSEGGETAALAGRQLEAARQSEYRAFDQDEARLRQQQRLAAAGAAGVAVLTIAALILIPSAGTSFRTAARPVSGAQPTASPIPVAERAETIEEKPRQASAVNPRPREAARAVTPTPPEADVAAATAVPTATSTGPDAANETAAVLMATAELCSELNRAHDVEQITRLLERAAQVLDASGLVVWVGAPGGSVLRPVLAHGYSPQALARMPLLPRTGDNAAATAFRTAKLQIVLTRPGVAAGALAAPMMSAEGCIGALTAEIRNGGETSDAVQALTTIVAAQLGGVLAESVLQSADLEDEAPASRIASA